MIKLATIKHNPKISIGCQILNAMEKQPIYKLKTPISICFVGDGEIRLIEDKSKIKIEALDLLMKKGGSWLGTIRNWIQCKFNNGEHVTWGSKDYLTGSFTVRELEDLASRIAAAAINEYINKKDL